MTKNVNMLIAFNMEKYTSDQELIAAEQLAQKQELTAICDFYGVSHTELTKRAGLAPSTINRFMSSKKPKNALSSITMKKIRLKFPMQQKSNTQMSGAEAALMYAVKEIIDILLRRKEATPYEMTKDFIYALDRYQNSPDAMMVMGDLLAHVKGESHRESQQTMRTLLQLSPPR